MRKKKIGSPSGRSYTAHRIRVLKKQNPLGYRNYRRAWSAMRGIKSDRAGLRRWKRGAYAFQEPVFGPVETNSSDLPHTKFKDRRGLSFTMSPSEHGVLLSSFSKRKGVPAKHVVRGLKGLSRWADKKKVQLAGQPSYSEYEHPQRKVHKQKALERLYRMHLGFKPLYGRAYGGVRYSPASVRLPRRRK